MAKPRLCLRLISDERGGEIVEYAMVAGFVVVAAIALIGAVGNKVVAWWSSLGSSQ